MIDPQRTLGDLVTTHPSAARVFHRYQLDYCCGGKQSLAGACRDANIDVDAVVREVDAAGAAQPEHPERWDQRPLDELIRHILDRYHAPLRTELPRLVELARKVERVHAAKPAVPAGLADLLVQIHDAVESHLAKEEQILFPMIESGNGAMAGGPIEVMRDEHDEHGLNLRRIRELTGDLVIPDGACTSWRELYSSLARLEADLMDHIHLENNVLFPRALDG